MDWSAQGLLDALHRNLRARADYGAVLHQLRTRGGELTGRILRQAMPRKGDWAHSKMISSGTSFLSGPSRRRSRKKFRTVKISTTGQSRTGSAWS